MELDNGISENGLGDIEQKEGSVPEVKPGTPISLIVNGVGLCLFSLGYMIVMPLLLIPSTFDPMQFCGVPWLGFVCIQIPIIIYGLIRWLTFPYIRTNAKKFHIFAFVYEMIWLAIPIIAWIAGMLSRTIIFRGIDMGMGGPGIAIIWPVLPLGGFVITIWSFFSLGPVRRRGMGLISAILIVLYIIGLFWYISYSRQSSPNQRFIRQPIPYEAQPENEDFN